MGRRRSDGMLRISSAERLTYPVMTVTASPMQLDAQMTFPLELGAGHHRDQGLVHFLRLRVLIVCESSGTVREAFRAMGHDAWSCDLLPADDGSPYHYQCDMRDVIGGNWDMVGMHPECTYMNGAGTADEKPDGQTENKEL